MYKWYGPADINKMDIPEFDTALQVAITSGLPKEIADKIWKKSGDSGYLEMMMPRKKDK